MMTLDLRGAAALMKVHPRTVEAMARDGRLPAAKIGRSYVLMERDVLDFIEQQIANQTARREKGKSACLPEYRGAGRTDDGLPRCAGAGTGPAAG